MSAASTTAPATTTTRTASPSPLPATLPEDSATPSCTDGQGACCTTSDLLDASPAEDLAAAFKALSDPTRVRLLAHIASAEHGTACACHLPEALGISQPTLSHHLSRLVASGLVAREQRGRWAHYSLVPEAVERLATFLADTSRQVATH